MLSLYCEKMKARFFLKLSLLLLALLALRPEEKMAAVGASRLPEHTCCKVIETARCTQEECRGKCAGLLRGAGQCRGAGCLCTFYCPQPPV